MTKDRFDMLSRELNDRLEKTETKVERIINDLTIRFSKEVELYFYKEMHKVFLKLRHIEAEMIEISH
eukprot:CAMPEP_0170492232 /NCGR_PEP_ID=MMETSP0208-20121228/11891_1 /TAXON_ID=197538 /ORGANISM="Strombidium inclinatum, Strain S3" /LENGTH=66 /DNA_ID=CAMNT_0010767939 /DNA_START=523 /DNA_END=723 /DNA_ORIENTATION=+